MSTMKAPPGDRMFARLRGFELACPRCDRVQLVTHSTSRRIWDPRTCRFQCMGCFLSLRIGLIAWPSSGGRWKIPNDITPTVRQALALRRELSLYAQTRLMRGRDVNVLALEAEADSPAEEAPE